MGPAVECDQLKKGGPPVSFHPVHWFRLVVPVLVVVVTVSGSLFRLVRFLDP